MMRQYAADKTGPEEKVTDTEACPVSLGMSVGETATVEPLRAESAVFKLFAIAFREYNVEHNDSA